ncbi:MAG: hypothetical protein CL624_06945 [Arcobacter sp.]|jgi:hypothetical protein|uniref:hypothetical protein n=2 Tax=Poseidonibacter ostreae TaxID=2654171 RepID=UPI000C96F0F6|nr:hypothetical protein [Poseidonibacter ostreae]KAB7888281.1 hypothetical protein GA417_00430 [Poseidonibacter ostreae]MAC83855.1 hypothetical protein [Arcobacter sp.]|tara:strand:+ start:4013 stop:4387 length:375 start_codon:yes stop_codon:yes gene_type:complete
MKLIKTIIAISLLSTLSLNAADSNSIKHFGFSAIFGLASETVLHKDYQQFDDIEKISYATAIGSLPGLAKELTDDKFSNEDMVFNVLGALSGAVFSNYLNNNTSIFIAHKNEEKSSQIKLAYKF